MRFVYRERCLRLGSRQRKYTYMTRGFWDQSSHHQRLFTYCPASCFRLTDPFLGLGWPQLLVFLQRNMFPIITLSYDEYLPYCIIINVLCVQLCVSSHKLTRFLSYRALDWDPCKDSIDICIWENRLELKQLRLASLIKLIPEGIKPT